MNYVYGRQCSVSLYKDDTYTALPYSQETIRTKRKLYPLEETVGHKRRIVEIAYGSNIEGCIITRVSRNTIIPLLSLLEHPLKPITLIIDRAVETILYKNIILLSFEIRASIDEALYIKFDITSISESSTEEGNSATLIIPWEKESTWFFRKDSFRHQGKTIPGIYAFTFTAEFQNTITYTLQIHTPLRKDSVIQKSDFIENISFNALYPLEIQFNKLQPLTDMNETDTAGEILVIRKYRVQGIISYKVMDREVSWGLTL